MIQGFVDHVSIWTNCAVSAKRKNTFVNQQQTFTLTDDVNADDLMQRPAEAEALERAAEGSVRLLLLFGLLDAQSELQQLGGQESPGSPQVAQHSAHVTGVLLRQQQHGLSGRRAALAGILHGTSQPRLHHHPITQLNTGMIKPKQAPHLEGF